MGPLELLTLATSLFAAVNHLYMAFLGGLSEGRSRDVNRLFSATALVLFWYCVWVALLNSGVVDHASRLVAVSQLFSGYFGPLVYLMARATVQPYRPLDRRLFGLLAFGLFGTAVFFYGFADPERGAAIWQAYVEGRLEDLPVAWVLFGAHTLEIGIFLIVSLVMLVRAALRERRRALRRQIRLMILAMVGGLGAWLVGNLFKYVAPELGSARLGPILTVPAVAIAYYAVLNSRGLIRELESQRRFMSGYLPQNIVQDIVTGEHRPKLGGELGEATILFSDIRGFTSLAEDLDPQEVVAFLNRYFTEMTEVVFRHGGMVNKFIGDAVLAVFGIPHTGRNDAEEALACARDMLRALEDFNASWAAQGHAPISIGIGLHRGRVVHGNVGSATRMEYTVIGDAVNTASRVEGLTKELGFPLVLTAEVARTLGEAERAGVRDLGERVLRGRSAPTRLFAVDAAVRSAA